VTPRDAEGHHCCFVSSAVTSHPGRPRWEPKRLSPNLWSSLGSFIRVSMTTAAGSRAPRPLVPLMQGEGSLRRMALFVPWFPGHLH
jgi:hypothetical protein